MKNHITASLKGFDEENQQFRWELLKYEIRKFSKSFCKQISLESNKDRKALRKDLKILSVTFKNLVTTKNT